MHHTIDCPCGRKDIDGKICPVCGTDLSPVIKLRKIADTQHKKNRCTKIFFITLLAVTVMLCVGVCLMLRIPTKYVSEAVPDKIHKEDADEKNENTQQNSKTVEQTALEIENVIVRTNLPLAISFETKGQEIVLAGTVQDEWVKKMLVAIAESYADPDYNVVSTGLVVDSREVKEERPNKFMLKYKIRKGDTLFNIAEAFLGDGELWRSIFEENKDIILTPDDIMIGQELTITITQ